MRSQKIIVLPQIIAKATQSATPHKIIGAPKLVLEPDSSPTEACELSGEELAGAVPGEALVDGRVSGEPAGVAELEGMPVDGASATGGAPTGLLTGATAGGGVAGDGAGGEGILLDGLEAGEIEDGG
ncbi:hypothetical protein E2542_SST29087 [Spatholobus suberectus]|nr:hypothetical protein E2542_SST29087 [Spatholobus suberectus]